jgi:hypothetical protein
LPLPDVASTGASVTENLALFRGVWFDTVTAFHPDGSPMALDVPRPGGGEPGGFPFQQLVYLDFDGTHLTHTNVVVRGRPVAARTFTGRVVDGILRFDGADLEEPGTIGVSGGPGVLVYLPERVDTDAHRRFADPDYVRHLGGDQRTRTTTLYRDGELTRVITVSGTRIDPDPTRRVSWDPRGPDGPAHEPPAAPRASSEKATVLDQ